jgi:hypothetical protein
MKFEKLLQSFDEPDEVREFPFGRFEIIKIAGIALGRASYQPGWKWSLHNAARAGTALCHVPHTGVAIAGHGVVQYETGERVDLLPGDVFQIASVPHDSWVEGSEPYISLHVLGL